MEAVFNATARNFGRVFQRQIVATNSLDELLTTSTER